MGENNPNAQVEANLREGQNRYASARTTLQDILKDLDSIAAGLQSSWLGGASQDYQDKYGKLTTTVQNEKPLSVPAHNASLPSKNREHIFCRGERGER